MVKCRSCRLPGVQPRAAQGPPGTDIWLADLTLRDGRVSLGTPVNVTARAGYDNQPVLFGQFDRFTRTGQKG